MVGCIMFGIFSIIFCLLFCFFRTKKIGIYSLGLKIVSSVCFILCGIFAINTVGSSSINLLIITGLVLGLIGDILLDLKLMYPNESEEYFVVGTISFGVGHFFYFISALLYNMRVLNNHLLWNILASVGIAIVMTTTIILLSKKLGLKFGRLLPAVTIYCAVLNFMTAFAIAIAIFNPIYWIFASGMILFLLSDLVLSMQYFGNATGKIWVYVNHILYYMAQILLAISIFFI